MLYLTQIFYRVKGLPTKKKYRFRILAENLAGAGKPSKETDPILVKNPIGKTKIFSAFLLKDIHTKA